MRDLQALVDAADEERLLLAVDGLCATRDWDDLVELARRCRDAAELGKQLWPVAMHIDYRLALEAPAPYAGAVLAPGAGRFALGPLTEVAAAGHPFAALAPYIGDPASAAAVAQERVLRGEDLREHLPDLAPELPATLAPFEPGYPLPSYRDRSAAFPQPEVALRAMPPVEDVPHTANGFEDQAARALRSVVETWERESSGQVRVTAVEGGAAAAVGLLAPQAALLRISPPEALALLQWAGASGGAHGRRRGGAAGRFAAWWAATALVGLAWPDQPDDAFVEDLEDGLAELVWFRWSTGPETGWVLRLAVADPVDGLAWAVEATDELTDDETELSDPSTAVDASPGTR